MHEWRFKIILVDLSQTAVSTLHVNVGNNQNLKIDEDLIRHMILNCLRSYNVRNKEKYGKMIVCADDSHNWRKQHFEYYKARRQIDKAASGINWSQFFDYLNNIKNEIKEFLPYPLIQVEGAEADDVIASFVFEYGTDFGGEKILILSGDRDLSQLQSYSNIDQYDPTHKHIVKESNTERYMFEKIIKGDSGDRVPNIFSDDDCFVMGKRQKPVYQKKIDEWIKNASSLEEFLNENQIKKFQRNKLLVDLKEAPSYIKEETLKQYKEQENKTKSKLFNYLISKKLKYLQECINDF